MAGEEGFFGREESQDHMDDFLSSGKESIRNRTQRNVANNGIWYHASEMVKQEEMLFRMNSHSLPGSNFLNIIVSQQTWAGRKMVD